ncbi:MAG TPA: hypothetical protein VF432_29690 [Thermoanaerobaculia bacterium]
MSLTFVVGTASDVFGADLARLIDAELGTRSGGERYESEPVNAMGWRALQKRVLETLDVAPQLTGIDAYQAVYLPGADGIQYKPVGSLADPLQVGSLDALLEELRRFAAAASLPTDDLELMRLAAQYLESEDVDADLDVQVFVQLMLSAKQAAARGQGLWVVV